MKEPATCPNEEYGKMKIDRLERKDKREKTKTTGKKQLE
jgi:hypothetical protein